MVKPAAQPAQLGRRSAGTPCASKLCGQRSHLWIAAGLARRTGPGPALRAAPLEQLIANWRSRILSTMALRSTVGYVSPIDFEEAKKLRSVSTEPAAAQPDQGSPEGRGGTLSKLGSRAMSQSSHVPIEEGSSNLCGSGLGRCCGNAAQISAGCRDRPCHQGSAPDATGRSRIARDGDQSRISRITRG